MDTNCPYCMSSTVADAPCPCCGQTPATYQPSVHHFPPGERLRDRYVVGRVLGEGGFGVTYLGLDVMLERKVAIKEYFPAMFVQREASSSLSVSCYMDERQSLYEKGRDQFLQEARLLAKLDKVPEIVQVLDFFPANNTAYIVMEFLEGNTFSTLLTESGGRIPAKTLLELLEPVLRAMDAMHAAGVIHRDISPDNMMQLKNGLVKLVDFGCARDTQEGTTLTVMLKHGYAPIEQYTGHNQGPWTDVYAMSATIYRCLTGQTPPKALERSGREQDPLVQPAKFGAAISSIQERAILKGLALEPKNRWQSISGLYAQLYGVNIDGSPWELEEEGEKTEPIWDSKPENINPQTVPLDIEKQERVPEAVVYLPNEVRTPDPPRTPSHTPQKIPMGIVAAAACCVIAVAAALGWKCFAPATVPEIPDEQAQDEAMQELDKEQSQDERESSLETMFPEKTSPQDGDKVSDGPESESEADESTGPESEADTNPKLEQAEPTTTTSQEVAPTEQDTPVEVQQEAPADQTIQEPEKTVSLTLEKDSFELEAGTEATIGFTVTGEATYAAYLIGEEDICESVDMSWEKGQTRGYWAFKALSPGKTTVKITLTDENFNALASQTVSITVSDSSASNADIGVTDPDVTLTLYPYLNELVPGDEVVFNFVFTGEFDGVAFDMSDESVFENTGVAIDTDLCQGYYSFKALSPGTTDITIYLYERTGGTTNILASQTVTVTVVNQVLAIFVD